MADEQVGPPPESRKSFADAAGVATFFLALSAAVLYSFGLAHRYQFLALFGFDPNQFPISFQEGVFLGGINGFIPILLSVTYLSLCTVVFFFFGPIQKYVPRWPRTLTIGISIALWGAGVAWSVYNLWHKWDNSDFAGLIIAAGFWVLGALAWTFPIARVPVVAAGLIVGLWYAWFLAQSLNIRLATKYVGEVKEAISKNPCERAAVYPKLVLERDGREPIRPPGVRIVCSERFCGLYDGTTKQSTVVSLEGVESIKTELPAGCPASSPEDAVSDRQVPKAPTADEQKPTIGARSPTQ